LDQTADGKNDGCRVLKRPCGGGAGGVGTLEDRRDGRNVGAALGTSAALATPAEMLASVGGLVDVSFSRGGGLGAAVDGADAEPEGDPLGSCEGCCVVGCAVGRADGRTVGAPVGSSVGCAVGATVG
jgi:hypothetical protein